MDDSPTFGNLGSSKFAAVYFGLNPTKRRVVPLSDQTVRILDALISICDCLTDDSDTRPPSERVGDTLDHLYGDPNSERINELIDYLSRVAETDIEKSVRDATSTRAMFIARRALGAGTYHQLAEGLHVDFAVLSVAVRRAIRYLMPLVVAMDDLMQKASLKSGSVPPAIANLDSTWSHELLAVLQKLDDGLLHRARFLPKKLAKEISALPPIRDVELEALEADLRVAISDRTRDLIRDLSATLYRKIQGARDVMSYSADAVSQAANSLTEFIDRMLRTAFPDHHEVLTWLDENFSDAHDLTYIDKDSGERLPTKRGQALCFSYAMRPVVAEHAWMNELLVAGLTSARRRLQELKHADDESEEDRRDLISCLAAIEGFIAVAIGILWKAGPDEDVSRLRERLMSMSKHT